MKIPDDYSDVQRVRSEHWPFRWAVPTSGHHDAAPRHPLDSPGPERPPAMVAERRRAMLAAGRSTRAYRDSVNAELAGLIAAVQATAERRR